MWIRNEWRSDGTKRLYRVSVPYCEAGCAFPETHLDSSCAAKTKPRVEDWALVRVELVPDPAAETKALAERCKRLWRWAHRAYDPITGHTAVSALSGESRAVAAARLGFEYEDLEMDLRSPLPDCLPRALVYGPIPFHRARVAEALRDLLEARPWPSLLQLDVPNAFSCDYAYPFVTRIPYGTRASDYAKTHADESSVSRTRLRGPPIPDRAVGEFRLETTDGRVYHSPEAYVRFWLTAKLDAMEEAIQETIDAEQKRALFARTVFVGARFTNAYGETKRKYLDETEDEKRARAEAEYGDAALPDSTPIARVGPDFDAGFHKPTHPRVILLSQLDAFLGSQR